MRLRKIAAAAAVAVLTVTTLAGCTTFDNFKEAFLQKEKSKDVTIQIGIYEPQSGADSKEAEDEIKGIELAHEVYLVVFGNGNNAYSAVVVKNVSHGILAVFEFCDIMGYCEDRAFIDHIAFDCFFL